MDVFAAEQGEKESTDDKIEGVIKCVFGDETGGALIRKVADEATCCCFSIIHRWRDLIESEEELMEEWGRIVPVLEFKGRFFVTVEEHRSNCVSGRSDSF